jgi:hypothetical protein
MRTQLLSLYDRRRAERFQDGLCAICKMPPSGKRSLAVDHDHFTGRIPCGAGLGHRLPAP